MPATHRNKILQLRPDTVDIIRKNVNLERAEDRKQVIDILREWIQQQPHFVKKDFSDSYLETCIVASKGSVEKAKKRLDKMCTLRTLIPEFFTDINPKEDFNLLFDITILTVCPKLTKEHHRVFITKAYETVSDPLQFTLFYKYCILISEYMRKYDYVDSFRIVYDLTVMDIMKFVSKLNVVEMRHALSIYMEGYGLKIKGIHIISQSKAIDIFVNIFKQVLKPKIGERISIHRAQEELFDIIGKEVLPSELGGDEKSIKEIHSDWIEALSSKDHLEYMREMNRACTDESLRPNNQFNEDYAGMPGTFRVLSVD